MKILMTGMAARGIGSTRVRHHITSLPDVLARAYEELGHDVDGPRRVSQGERLDAFDVILVQLGWVSSLSSTYAHEAALVMATAERIGVPVVRYVDDWRSQWLADDIAGHVVSDRGWQRHTERFRREQWAAFDADTKARCREALIAPISDAPLCVPIMGWGDPSRFDVSTKARLSRVVPFDPQSLCDYVETEWASDETRERRWVVASLQEHDRWVADQGLTWPVLRLGANPKAPGGVPVRGTQNGVVPEAEVLQRYAESWGVLSPEYGSAGSGYWRTRWDQAMGAGAIIWPGATDAEAIGGPFAGLTPAKIEGLSTEGLARLQAEMADTLDGHKAPRREALYGVSRLLTLARTSAGDGQ